MIKKKRCEKRKEKGKEEGVALKQITSVNKGCTLGICSGPSTTNPSIVENLSTKTTTLSNVLFFFRSINNKTQRIECHFRFELRLKTRIKVPRRPQKN